MGYADPVARHSLSSKQKALVKLIKDLTKRAVRLGPKRQVGVKEDTTRTSIVIGDRGVDEMRYLIRCGKGRLKCAIASLSEGKIIIGKGHVLCDIPACIPSRDILFLTSNTGGFRLAWDR